MKNPIFHRFIRTPSLRFFSIEPTDKGRKRSGEKEGDNEEFLSNVRGGPARPLLKKLRGRDKEGGEKFH